MSQSRVVAAAMAGAVGLSFAPAFVLPGTAREGAATLRGAAGLEPRAPQAQAQAGVASAALACTGVLGAAAAAAAAAQRPAARSRSVAVRHAFDPSTQVGVTAPLGYFDPLGIAKGKDEKEFKRLRAAELAHGRAAMMASLGLLTTSVYKLPGYESVPGGLGAQWTEPGSTTLAVVFFAIGCLEIGLSPWKENPEVPGDYGDPLNLAKGNLSVDMQNKELNNGRMAMFAVVGIISAELFTGREGAAQFACPQKLVTAARPGFCGASLAARPARSGALRAFDASQEAGAVAPLGYFDPLGLSTDKEKFDKFRTSELKHGRVAMLAILGAFAHHWGHAPGAESVPAGMAAFSDPMGMKGVVALTLFCGFVELGPWADKFAAAPGNFGDPGLFAAKFGVPPDDKAMQTKELSNGRLAMLATIGGISAEMATGSPVTDLPGQLGL